MKEEETKVTMNMSEVENVMGEVAKRVTDQYIPKGEGQLDLTGGEAKYPIDHDLVVTHTHKFSSAIAKLSVTEKALEDWRAKESGDTSTVGLVKTKLSIKDTSVIGKQWEALCEEFARAVEEEM